MSKERQLFLSTKDQVNDTHHTESRSKGQQKHHIEIQKTIHHIKPPRFSTENVRTSVGTTKDIVENNIEWHKLDLAIKEIINSNNRGL
jgi:hypothetical protein